MNTTRIIQSTERLYTLIKRAAISTNRDDHRDAILGEFEAMCAALGKTVTRFKPTDWQRVHLNLVDLHSAAVHADEFRSGSFAHFGSEASLLTSLHAFAAVLGFMLADAGPAPIHETILDDHAAMAAVEGHEIRSAAE